MSRQLLQLLRKEHTLGDSTANAHDLSFLLQPGKDAAHLILFQPQCVADILLGAARVFCNVGKYFRVDIFARPVMAISPKERNKQKKYNQNSRCKNREKVRRSVDERPVAYIVVRDVRKGRIFYHNKGRGQLDKDIGRGLESKDGSVVDTYLVARAHRNKGIAIELVDPAHLPVKNVDAPIRVRNNEKLSRKRGGTHRNEPLGRSKGNEKEGQKQQHTAHINMYGSGRLNQNG